MSVRMSIVNVISFHYRVFTMTDSMEGGWITPNNKDIINFSSRYFKETANLMSTWEETLNLNNK